MSQIRHVWTFAEGGRKKKLHLSREKNWTDCILRGRWREAGVLNDGGAISECLSRRERRRESTAKV